MKYPQFLKEKGTIGFVAPSCGCALSPYREAFQNALCKWEKSGYGLDLGPNCYADKGIGISNTPEKCGRELTEYYLRKENDVLISCGGGELMCETLEYGIFRQYQYDLSAYYPLRYCIHLWSLCGKFWDGTLAPGYL